MRDERISKESGDVLSSHLNEQIGTTPFDRMLHACTHALKEKREDLNTDVTSLTITVKVKNCIPQIALVTILSEIPLPLDVQSYTFPTT
jgi:hypothetical protein